VSAPDQSDALKRAMAALDRMQARLEQAQNAAHEPIAIIGLGCRFPQADGPDAFWQRLSEGYSAVGEVPTERAALFASADAACRKGGFLEDVAGFDADRFGVSEDAALAMDPHQRILLETSWSAFEDAGCADGTLAGSRTGVYLGLGAQNSDYAWWFLDHPERMNAHVIPGSFHSLMPGRISYLLDLRGPSMVIDAACASALVAVHVACQALRRTECDLALAAAVNLVLSPAISQAVGSNGLLSATGGCRSFDETADGFVRGEGAGAIVLKRLSDALRDGDAIRAVIQGSAVGQDGHSNGLTAPNGPAQEAVLRHALEDGRLKPDRVGYVEAHATGTRLGDAIEAQAIGAVYGVDRAMPLRLGAVKPNLGHLEAASGMAGLIKTLLAREAGQLPPTRRPEQLNSDIDEADLGVSVVTEASPWPDAAPYAGISAFGMSGTNAHLILGPAPSAETSRVRPPQTRFVRKRFWPDWLDQSRVERSVAAADLPPNLPDRFLHRVVWEAAPQSRPTGTGGVVLMAGDAAFADRLTAGLQECGFEPVELSARTLEAHPNAPVAYQVAEPLELDLDTLRISQERDLGGLVSLIQSLAVTADRGRAQRRLLIVTEAGTEGAVVPAMALAIGRSVGIEHADLACRRIDLAADLDVPGRALAMEIANAKSDEDWVRFAQAGRQVPRIVPIVVPSPHPEFRVRPQGSYLVTGAFGGVGREVARWLVALGAKDLLLIGRTPKDLPEFALWRAQGVRVRSVAADVGDPTALREALAALDAEGVALTGVFHVAGVTGDALISRLDWPTMARTLRAKSEGALVLDRLTRDRDLDVFVMFSSITAVTGLVGTAAYAAANAGLSAVARRRRQAGLPAHAVSWGTWGGSGMATMADPALARQWERHGFRPFAPAVGLKALGAILAAPDMDPIAGDVDWDQLARWCREEGSGARLYDRVSTGAKIPDSVETETARTSKDLERIVRQSVAGVVHLSPENPMLDKSFGALDLGSLAAIELRNRLSEKLNIPIPATLAFNHPSIAQVVRFLSGRISLEGGGSREIESDTSAVAEMSETEAESRMAALLAELESDRKS
jgi:acyl transferase domain-containing protein/acyl carrier protein